MGNPSLLDGLEDQTHKANCACFDIAKGWTPSGLFLMVLITLVSRLSTSDG